MADEATLWTKGKLTTPRKKIITRAFDEQQNNLFNVMSGIKWYINVILSGNFEISKQQIAEVINELKQSIEHTKKVLEDKVACVEENLGHIESRVQEIFDYQIDPAIIEDKLIDLEDRWRQNNLRVN